MRSYKKTTLVKVNINQECTIIDIDDSNTINKKRIMDLGFIKRTKVTPLFCSMFGETYAYKVKESIIALRKADCKSILVKIAR